MDAFATSHKVQLLLKTKGGEAVPETLLFGAPSARSARPPTGFGVRAGVRIPRAPEGAGVGGGAGGGDGTFVGSHPSAANVDRVFDAMWEVAGPTPDWETMGRLAQDRLDDLASWVDRPASAVSAGTEWTLVPDGADQDAVMLLYPMRRLSGLTCEEFQDYWLHVHGRFGIGNPNVAGYRQFHVDHRASAEVNAGLGLGTSDFDGVAESFLPTLEAFGNIRTEQGQTQQVLDDEQRFIDYRGSATMELYRYRVLVPVQKDGA